MSEQSENLGEVVDKELLARACGNKKKLPNTILNAAGPRWQLSAVPPEEVTNERLLEIYNQEFERTSFPSYSISPRFRGIGPHAFLAIEDYLVSMGILDEPRYRSHLEARNTTTYNNILGN